MKIEFTSTQARGSGGGGGGELISGGLYPDVFVCLHLDGPITGRDANQLKFKVCLQRVLLKSFV